MIRKQTKYLFILFLLISFSISIKVFFLDKNFSEIDDRISIIQILRYKNESLYSIANDKLSPNYNSQIKKKIREIENKNNKFFDFSERIISNILMRAAPSKHSTYAPMQYWLFADLINKDQSYDELKFFSRIPSVFFSILYILVTYFFCSYIFKKENKFSLSSVFILTLSFPLLYISLRSYNFAAGTFTTTLIFFLTYLEIIGKNFSFIKLSSNKINIKNSIYLGFIFSLLSYLNYSVFFILPIFFIVCFFKNLELKKIFSNINFNLLIVGICFLFFSCPLIIHIFKMNLHQYGVTGSTAGDLMEYHLSSDEKKDQIYVILFYIKNFYLIVSRNLSFFTDNFFLSKFLQLVIFSFVCIGILISRRENQNLKMFSNFVITFIIYYFILVYFEVITLGPTTHSNFFTPLFSILFIISLRFIYNYAKPRYNKFLFNFFVLFTTIVFFYSLQNFYKKYTDPFNEDYILNLINEYNVGYISTDAGLSDQLCLMKSIKVLIRTCPIKFHRYTLFNNLDQINLKNIKKNNKSIMFVNDKLNNAKYGKLLEKKKFELIKEIDKSKFTFKDSPLYITEYEPNIFKVYIYK